MNETDRATPKTNPERANNVVPIPAYSAEPRPSDKVIAFVKRHPMLTVAGALAAGAAVSALIPRSRRVMGKALRLAETAGAATATFGREAGEKAQAEASYFGRSARKEASRLADRAEKAGDHAVLKLEKYGLAALAAASALARSAAQRASEVGEAAAEQAARLGDVAAEQSHRVRHKHRTRR